MTYSFLTTDSTISADEVRENFEHIGSGDFLPRSGAFLTSTSSALDLGSQTYEWRTLHAQNLEISVSGTVAKAWNLVAETILTETATSIEITGLNGNTANFYNLRFSLNINLTTTISMILNGDSASSYSLLRLINSSGSIVCSYATTSTDIYQISGVGGYHIFAEGYLSAKAGIPRAFIYSSSNVDAANLKMIEAGNMWSNTSDTLTSIKIYTNPGSGFGTGTSFAIWKAGNE